MKLNIGCGKVIIPGWINVDVRDGNIKGDIRILPFKDNSFHIVLASHVLEHILDCRTAIHELYRVLKSNAWLVIRVPYGVDGLYDPFHMRAFDLTTFRRFEYDDKQSLEYKRMFKIEKQYVSSYAIPFEKYIGKTRLLNHFPKRWPDIYRPWNPFPLTKRSEITCILRAIK